MLRVFTNIADLESSRFNISPRNELFDIDSISEEDLVQWIEESMTVTVVNQISAMRNNENGVNSISLNALFTSDDVEGLIKYAYFNVKGQTFLFMALANGTDFDLLEPFNQVFDSIKPLS